MGGVSISCTVTSFQGIMAGVGSPEVIIEGHASAHHFSLKPSHVRLLQQADLVIWIDDHFESGFHDLADTLPGTTRQLQLVPQLSLSHDDGHIWYSPILIGEVTRLITTALEQLDPVNQARYRENSKRLTRALDDWRQQAIRQGLPAVDKIVSEHDFLFHFTADFGLGPVISVHDTHDDHGGLRELSKLEIAMVEQQISCLVGFHDNPIPLAQRLVDKFELEVVNISTLPTETEGIPKIVARLEQLRQGLLACPA